MVQKIETPALAETLHTLKTSSSPEGRILSLDDGAHYFAENRKVIKQTKRTSLKDVVDNFGLPKEIVERLKNLK